MKDPANLVALKLLTRKIENLGTGFLFRYRYINRLVGGSTWQDIELTCTLTGFFHCTQMMSYEMLELAEEGIVPCCVHELVRACASEMVSYADEVMK
jgi:hypothetical protein